MLAVSLTALPAATSSMSGCPWAPAIRASSWPSFAGAAWRACRKALRRSSQAKKTKAIDNKLVVAYFAARLAADARCKIAAVKEGEDVLFTLEVP